MDEASVRQLLVIGAGQAGLAMGYHLQRAGTDFVIVDSGSQVGHVWRSRWDSLRLFTPAQYAGLPGVPFPAPADSYPGRDDVADYLAAYAERLSLPIQLDTTITSLTKTSDRFTATSSTGQTVHAKQVVVATGPFSRPFTPALAAALDENLGQLHTVDYRNPTQIPPGPVLVVGGGNSGFQIAAELADVGHQVELAEDCRNACAPQRPHGRDVFWW
ncbi:NAD(P)/FAD-dependent oxidoreductase [Kribbella sp. NPDC051718]|uniref:flavin-containing monooxygenase n=1 Tax=Kribbella sp. NPDC051718 TaxID=3155168 RepID=UPI00341CFCF0